MCDLSYFDGGMIIHRDPPQESFCEKVKRVFKRKEKKKKKS